MQLTTGVLIEQHDQWAPSTGLYLSDGSLKTFADSAELEQEPTWQLDIASSMDTNPHTEIAPLHEASSKALQYLESGVPCMDSGLPAIREILTDRINSLVVEPDNPSAWIDAIGLLRDERSLASSLSKNATHLFNSNYTWNMRAQKILDFAGTQSVTGFETSPRRKH